MDPATIQSRELCRHPQNNNASDVTRQRRVYFIDEALGLSPHSLVTSTAFRPPTTAEEKCLLYYTPQDYASFALEDYHHQAETNQMGDYDHQVETIQTSQSKGLSWEDCMVYDYDYGNDIHIQEGCTMHKVETLCDLQI